MVADGERLSDSSLGLGLFGTRTGIVVLSKVSLVHLTGSADLLLKLYTIILSNSLYWQR